MPIIDPKTNLRSLKYSQFSTIGDPLVVKDIPDVNKDGPSKGFLKQVTARTDDATRMTRLLVLQGGKRNPAGNKFTANLALLNQQESIEKAKKGEFKGLGKSLLGGALDTGKTIASILAQVPVAGTGTHFVNGGKVGKDYLNTSGGLLGKEGIDGARAALDGATIIADSLPKKGKNGRIVYVDYTAGENSDAKLKDAYNSSVLRAGLDVLDSDQNRATKERTEDGNQIFKEKYTLYSSSSLAPSMKSDSDGTVRFENSITEENYIVREKNTLLKNKISNLNQLANELKRSKPDTNGKFDKEFGKVSDNDKTKIIYIKATKKGLGNPFGVGNPYGADELNLFGGGGQTIDDSFLTATIPDKISEIIPFEFQVFDPKKGGNAQYLYFRAYLDSFNDSFTGTWNGTKYIGRAEEVYNYTGFGREVSFDFKIAAMSSAELRPLYRKLNFFAGVTAPSYDDNGSFMRGVFTKVSIGDYLQAVPGFFSSINLSWDTNYPWEIGFNADGEENDVPRNPTILNVSTTFKPIHNFNPELGQSFIGSSRSVNA